MNLMKPIHLGILAYPVKLGGGDKGIAQLENLRW